MPLSYSQLATFRTCPKQYAYAYVENIPRAISAGESFGSSVHNTLRRYGNLEMEHQAVLDPTKQLTLFVEDHSHHRALDLSLTTLLSLWRECFIAQGYASKKIMEEKLRSGAKALEHFYVWWEEKPRKVLAIEKGFSLALGEGIPALTGRFDRIERTDRGLSIIDFKTSKPRGAASIDADLQLSVYALAAEEMWHEPIAELTLLSVTETGIVAERTTRSAADLARAKEEILRLHEGIETKDFAPLPSVEKCRHCPYATICPARAG